MTAPSAVATYGGKPDSSDLDFVRFLVGDTDTERPELRDSEINGLITLYGIGMAPVHAAEAIAAKYAHRATYQTGKSKRELGALSDKFRQLAKDLRVRSLGSSVTPWAGGIDPEEAVSDAEDSTISDPAFKRDQFRNDRAPRTPGSGYTPESTT